MQNATDPTGRFVGHWAVDRHIHDFDAAWRGRFIGRATFAPVPGALEYAEEGLLQLGGLRMNATRRYRYVLAEPERVEVFFSDGREFHYFDPSEPRSEAIHTCDEDTYEIAYIFFPDGRWRTEWRVEGPRKDYRLVTIYSRMR